MGQRRLHPVTVSSGRKLLGTSLFDVLACDVLLDACGNMPAAIYYDKKHVFATEIKSDKYLVSPRAPTLCIKAHRQHLDAVWDLCKVCGITR